MRVDPRNRHALHRGLKVNAFHANEALGQLPLATAAVASVCARLRQEILPLGHEFAANARALGSDVGFGRQGGKHVHQVERVVQVAQRISEFGVALLGRRGAYTVDYRGEKGTCQVFHHTE